MEVEREAFGSELGRQCQNDPEPVPGRPGPWEKRWAATGNSFTNIMQRIDGTLYPQL